MIIARKHNRIKYGQEKCWGIVKTEKESDPEKQKEAGSCEKAVGTSTPRQSSVVG